MEFDVIINGIFSFFIVIVCTIVGIKIILKYKKNKNRTVILIGIAWIGIAEPWWPSSVSFIVAIFNQIGISENLYLFLNCAFLPIFLLIWIVALEDPLMFYRFKMILIIHIIISIVLESLLFYFLFTDISVIGNVISIVDINFGILTMIFLIYILLTFVITGFIFAIRSLKVDDPEIKLRGKFFLIAFTLFLLGAIMETILTTIFNRIILFSSAIIFYFGYITPDKIRAYFLK